MYNKFTKDDMKSVVKVACLFGAIVLFALLFKIFILDDISKKSNRYLIAGNYLIWQKTNKGWNQVNEFDEKLAANKYTITDGKSVINDATLQISPNNNWYFFDDDYNQIKMDKFRVATINLTVNLADYEKVDALNDKYVQMFFKEKKFAKPESYRASMVTYDFDGDGNEETLYTVNNSTLSAVDYDLRAFLFTVKDGKIVMLNETKGNDPFCIMEVLDIDDDNEYEVIVSKGVLNIPTFDSCYLLYKIVNGKWELIRSCGNK